MCCHVSGFPSPAAPSCFLSHFQKIQSRLQGVGSQAGLVLSSDYGYHILLFDLPIHKEKTSLRVWLPCEPVYRCLFLLGIVLSSLNLHVFLLAFQDVYSVTSHVISCDTNADFFFLFTGAVMLPSSTGPWKPCVEVTVFLHYN